jgi:hypothetical protein
MLKAFLCAIALLTLAMARSVNAQEPATSPSIQVPGTECDIFLMGLSFDTRPILRTTSRSIHSPFLQRPRASTELCADEPKHVGG